MSVNLELLEALINAEKKLLALEHMVGGGDDEISLESEILSARAAIAHAEAAMCQGHAREGLNEQGTIMTDLESRAQAFAHKAHSSVGHLRKYTGEPYINHPAAVVELVRSVPHSPEMLAAGWLHDTVEDCGIDLLEIHCLFGIDVARLVEMLTDVSKPEDGNRAARKAIDREHTARCSAQAATIKLADLIDNTKSIVERDPEFEKVYLAEKRELLKVLTHGDRTLWWRAFAQSFHGFLP